MDRDNIVVLGADHNGIEFKEQLIPYLEAKGLTCIDVGPYPGQKKVDYVDYADIVAHIVDSGQAARGILICGTGVGMSMVANRYDGVRAALVHNVKTAPKTREHNNANVLCLGAWVNSPETNFAIADEWFGETFAEGRHTPRVVKFDKRKDAIVFTNGIFDILHPGHIKLLTFAKSLGTKLIVGLNSDASTKRLKGPERPINPEHVRKEILQSIGPVDEVVIFEEDTPQRLVNELQPNIIVKGGEWTSEEVRKRDNIPAHIDVVTFPVEEGFSTTNIIQEIRARESGTYSKEAYDAQIKGGSSQKHVSYE